MSGYFKDSYLRALQRHIGRDTGLECKGISD